MNQRLKSALIHSALFIVTFCTTTVAGSFWVHGRVLMIGFVELNPGYTWDDFALGLPYSITFLLILTVHEFGHYCTAMYYRIGSSLPYYIPLPPLPFSFGTLGALIRIRSRIYSRTQNFDVGIAGPLAGFVIAIVMMFYDRTTSSNCIPNTRNTAPTMPIMYTPGDFSAMTFPT